VSPQTLRVLWLRIRTLPDSNRSSLILPTKNSFSENKPEMLPRWGLSLTSSLRTGPASGTCLMPTNYSMIARVIGGEGGVAGGRDNLRGAGVGECSWEWHLWSGISRLRQEFETVLRVESVHRWTSEAQVIGQLVHPHVTDIYWARTVGMRTVVCMPFVGISTLSDVIAASFPPSCLDQPESSRVILEAAEADV